MDNEYHFYIISYDLDTKDDLSKSKRVIDFLKKHHAICLTKSTWLLCNKASCFAVYECISKLFYEDNEYAGLFGWGFFNKGYVPNDRLFVAEITGNVFFEKLICDDRNSDSAFSLKELIKASGSNLIQDGFDVVYG